MDIGAEAYGSLDLNSLGPDEIGEIPRVLLEIYRDLNPDRRLELEEDRNAAYVVEKVGGGTDYSCTFDKTGTNRGCICFHGTEAEDAKLEFKKRFNLDGAEDPAERVPMRS